MSHFNPKLLFRELDNLFISLLYTGVIATTADCCFIFHLHIHITEFMIGSQILNNAAASIGHVSLVTSYKYT